MSRENVETIQRACEAWGTGDISIYREMYAPDATGYAGRLSPETSGELKGRDEIISVLESLMGTFEHSELVPGSFTDHGEVVVVRLLMRARHRGSSGTIEWSLWVVYRFRESLIVYQAWYSNRDEALEAAGLQA